MLKVQYHHQKWGSRHHCRQPGGGTEDRPELLNASNCVTWGFHMFYVIFYKTWYMLYLTNGLGQTLIFQTRLYENPKSRPTVTLLQRLLAGIYLKWWEVILKTCSQTLCPDAWSWKRRIDCCLHIVTSLWTHIKQDAKKSDKENFPSDLQCPFLLKIYIMCKQMSVFDRKSAAHKLSIFNCDSPNR